MSAPVVGPGSLRPAAGYRRKRRLPESNADYIKLLERPGKAPGLYVVVGDNIIDVSVATTARDLYAAAAVDLKAFRDAGHLAQDVHGMANDARNGVVFNVWSGARSLGSASQRLSGHAHFNGFAVDPELPNAGVAMAMLRASQYTAYLAKKAGIVTSDMVTATARRSNVRSCRLLAQAGFSSGTLDWLQYIIEYSAMNNKAGRSSERTKGYGRLQWQWQIDPWIERDVRVEAVMPVKVDVDDDSLERDAAITLGHAGATIVGVVPSLDPQWALYLLQYPRVDVRYARVADPVVWERWNPGTHQRHVSEGIFSTLEGARQYVERQREARLEGRLEIMHAPGDVVVRLAPAGADKRPLWQVKTIWQDEHTNRTRVQLHRLSKGDGPEIVTVDSNSLRRVGNKAELDVDLPPGKWPTIDELVLPFYGKTGGVRVGPENGVVRDPHDHRRAVSVLPVMLPEEAAGVVGRVVDLVPTWLGMETESVRYPVRDDFPARCSDNGDAYDALSPLGRAVLNAIDPRTRDIPRFQQVERGDVSRVAGGLSS